ncbi:MAG: hypothetical protein GX444_09775 [Myxococcales bacterium]|nr:hypothetical protein [Myxococcales bacterium]
MDDLKKMRGFPNMDWMVRSAMRMTARPSGLIHANEIILKNGPTQISLEKQTGNILYIENVKTGHVYSKTEVPGATTGSKSGVEIKSQQEAKGTNPPFTLFLFWRHFGPDHLGCILHCDQITFKTKIKKDKENHALHLTWDISHLGLIQWGYVFKEFACQNSGGYYSEELDGDNQDFVASESGQIPKSIDFSDSDFLRIRTSIRIDAKGHIYFGDFHIKRITEDREKADDKNFQFGLYGFEYPIIRGLKEIDPRYPNKNYLVYSHQEGKLLRNPHKRLRELDDSLDSNNIINTLRMTYPNGYDGSMQFMALFSETKNTGLYFATHDDSMKEKSFALTAVGEVDNPHYQFSMVHWSDDLCSGYDHHHRIVDSHGQPLQSNKSPKLSSSMIPTNAGTTRLKAILDRQTEGLSPSSKETENEYDEYIPHWKDYRQDDYWFLLREFDRKRDVISWYDAADIYKSWARNPGGPAWAGKPRIYREGETEKFYRETGYAIWLLGAEFAQAREGNNFLKAFHNILYSSTPEQKSRVLFVMGWDWHYPFGRRYNDGYQFGNKPEYWRTRFGPADNVLLNYDEIKKNGDFLIPTSSP